ncbi:MAG: hypothetical protein ACXVCY_18620 [Pseudobdellovibrionaceae bacterium]
MLRKISIFVSVCSFSVNIFADQTYGYFIGGGGDVGKEQTIYYPDLQRYFNVSKSKNWSSQFIYNGGHKNDEVWLNQKAKGNSKNFSTENFNRTVDEIKNKILKNQITSKDQLLIFVATHGYEKETGKPGHEIQTTDSYVNMTALKVLIKASEDKGIRLAIVDNSCHSGPTLDLSVNTKHTCIVTMAQDDVAYAGDSFRLLESMKTEKNLEDAYIKARSKPLDDFLTPGQPQISTASGKQVGKMMQPFSEDLHDYFREYQYTPVNPTPCKIRQTSLDDMKSLFAKINSEENLIADAQMQAYKKEIKAYRENQNAVIEIFTKVKDLDQEVCYQLAGSRNCMNFSEMEFRESYHKELLAKKKDPYGISKEMLNNLDKIKKSPQYQSYRKGIENLKQANKTIKQSGGAFYEKSRRISTIERETYAKKYLDLSKKGGKFNPCHDFKL